VPYLLRRWWARKYRLPPTSDEYLRYTPEELLVEFFEDYFESQPDQQLRRGVDERSGQTYFVTGDPDIDQWEREVAAGHEPDYDAPLSPAQRAAETVGLARIRQAEDEGFEGIEERFDVR